MTEANKTGYLKQIDQVGQKLNSPNYLVKFFSSSTLKTLALNVRLSYSVGELTLKEQEECLQRILQISQTE